MNGTGKGVERLQGQAKDEALAATELAARIPAKTNLPQLAVADANRNIDALLMLSYAGISSASVQEADSGIREARAQAAAQQLGMGLALLENAAASTKNPDAAWLAQRGAEYLESGAYGKAYACLMFGNSLLFAPGSFEENSAVAKIRGAASEAQGLGAKGLEEMFSSGKAENLIFAYNVEIEAKSIEWSEVALMDSGARIQRAFGKREAEFIFTEAARAQELSQKAVSLSREGKAGEAAAAITQAELIMQGVAEYVSALELRRGMLPPARGGKGEYKALVGQAEQNVREIRGWLERAGALEPSQMDAETVGGAQQGLAENSYSIRMASAQADVLRLEKSAAGYAGAAGNRLEGAVDAASEKIREGKFEEAQQIASLALAYKQTFEKSSYSGIASGKETLEQARRAAGLRPGEDKLLQGRMKLARALDFVVSEGESEEGKQYDVLRDLRGSAVALASVRAGGKQMEGPRESHEKLVAEAKGKGVEVDTSGAEKELREMGRLALKGDVQGVWSHGYYNASAAIAEERMAMYDALGATEIARAVATKEEELIALNRESRNVAGSLNLNAKELRNANAMEKDMEQKAQVLASNAEVAAKELWDHSWRLEGLDLKVEEYKGKYLGEFAGRPTPEGGREGKRLLREQEENAERAKYLIALGRGMEVVTGDALTLMHLTNTGGESYVADNAIVRSMSFMKLDSAMGNLLDASFALCGFDRYADGPHKVGDARYWERNSHEAYSQYREAQEDAGQALAIQWGPTLQYESGEEQRLAASQAYSRHKGDMFAAVLGIGEEKVPGSAARRASAADQLMFASYTLSTHPLEMPIFDGYVADNLEHAAQSMRAVSSASSETDVRYAVSETESQVSYAQMNYDVAIGFEGFIKFAAMVVGGPVGGFISAPILIIDMVHGLNTQYLRDREYVGSADFYKTLLMGAALGAGKLAKSLSALEAAAGAQKGIMAFHNTTFTVLLGEGAYLGGGMFYEGIKSGDTRLASMGAQEMFKTLPFLAQTAHPGAWMNYDLGRAFRRGVDYFRSPAAPSPRVGTAIVEVDVGPEPGGAGTPVPKAGGAARAEGGKARVEVDLGAKGPARGAVPERAEVSPVPTEAEQLHYAMEKSFSGIKMVRGADGKAQPEYILQDGVIIKAYSEPQVRFMEEAIGHAETIVRGELVEAPADVRRMAERLAVDPEFVRATERLDILRSTDAKNYDPRTIAGFYGTARRTQISLAIGEFEKVNSPMQYEAELAAGRNFGDALAEVRAAVKASKGSDLGIEFTFGDWKLLEPGESVRVDIPAEGGGLRAERVRIERMAPAEYGGGNYIITYTVERTGSTGMLALDGNANALQAHNALAAKTLMDVRAFERAGAQVEIPAELAADFARAEPAPLQARPFKEVWEQVLPMVQAIGDRPGVVRFEQNQKPAFIVEAGGREVGVRINEVRAMGGDKIFINITPVVPGEGSILVPARSGQEISEIMSTIKRKVGDSLGKKAAKPAGRPLEMEEPFEGMETPAEKKAPKPPEAEMPKAVEDTLLSSVAMRIPEGKKLGVEEPRMRGLARRAWDEVYRGRKDAEPLTPEELNAYGIMKGQLSTRFNAVAEIAFQDLVAERAGGAPAPSRILEAERPAYGRMRNLMGIVLDGNAARIEAGTKPGEIISPSQFVSDYRVYLQRGVGLPRGVAEAAEAAGVRTEIIYEGKYVAEVKDASQTFGIGDVHGDPVVPISTLKGAGVIIDLRPDLAVTDASVPFGKRYLVNPEIAKGTQIIFTGDYVDRGANSVEAVEFVQWLQGAVESLGNGSHVHTLRGNHEALFLRAYEICKGKSDAEMAQLVKDMREYADLSGMPGKTAEQMGRFTELHMKMAREFETHGLAILNIGLTPTFENILGRYGAWSAAKRGMEAEGGMVSFMRGTKAAVMITGDKGREMFTHAGPATRAEALDANGNAVHDSRGQAVYREIRTIEELEGYYEGMLGKVDNWWAYNTAPADPAQQESYVKEMYSRANNGDFSGLYVSGSENARPVQLKWSPKNEETLSSLRPFAENLGITGINVGHRAGERIRSIGSFETSGGEKVEVNCIDGALSEAYSHRYGENWRGGILYKNSWDGNYVIQGRRNAPGNIEQPTEMLPFDSQLRMENAYTKAARKAGQMRESPPEAAKAAPEVKAPEPAPAGVGTLGELVEKQKGMPAAGAPVGKTLAELAAESQKAPAAEKPIGGMTLGQMAAEANKQAPEAVKAPTAKEVEGALEEIKRAEKLEKRDTGKQIGAAGDAESARMEAQAKTKQYADEARAKAQPVLDRLSAAGLEVIPINEVEGANARKAIGNNTVREGAEKAVYVKEGKVEGRPSVMIRGVEYGVLPGKAEGAVRVVLAGDMLVVPNALANALEGASAGRGASQAYPQTKEGRIKASLRGLFEADPANAEKIAAQLSKTRGWEKTADYIEKNLEALKKKNVLSYPGLIKMIEAAEALSSGASRMESLGMREVAANRHSRAASLFEQLGNFEREGEHHVKAAENNLKTKRLSKFSRKYDDQGAAWHYAEAARCFKESNPERAAELYKKASETRVLVRDPYFVVLYLSEAAYLFKKTDPALSAQILESGAAMLERAAANGPKGERNEVADEFYKQAARGYSQAAEIIKESDPGKAAELYEKTVDAHIKSGDHLAAINSYYSAMFLLEKTNPELVPQLGARAGARLEGAAASLMKSGQLSLAAHCQASAAFFLEKINPGKAGELYALAAETEQKTGNASGADRNYESSARSYSDAAEALRETNPEKAAEFYERAGNTQLKNGKAYEAAESYSKGAELIRETDPGRAAHLYESAGENYVKAGESFKAADSYSKGAGLLAKTNPPKAAELYEKAGDENFAGLDPKRALTEYQLAIQTNPASKERVQSKVFFLSLKEGLNPELPAEFSALKKSEQDLILQAIKYNDLSVLFEIKIWEPLHDDPASLYSLLKLNMVPLKELVEAWPSRKAEIIARERGRSEFNPENELHLQIEYGKYLWELKSISKGNEWLLGFSDFKQLVKEGKKSAELDRKELDYTVYEVEQSAARIAPLLKQFGDMTLIGNMRTGHLYAVPIRRKLGGAGFYDTARIGSTELHGQEYILKPDLMDKVVTYRLLGKGIPAVVVDATPSANKVPDAFKGYRAWAAAMDLIIMARRGVPEGESILKASELTGIPAEIVSRISADLKKEGNPFRKMAAAWALHPERTPLIRVYDMDLDGVGAYRIKRGRAHDYTEMQSIKNEMPSGRVEGEVPLVLFQPSMGQDKIPVSVQERIGAGPHKKGYLDDLDSVLKITLTFDKDGVHLSANIAETVADKIEGAAKAKAPEPAPAGVGTLGEIVEKQKGAPAEKLPTAKEVEGALEEIKRAERLAKRDIKGQIGAAVDAEGALKEATARNEQEILGAQARAENVFNRMDDAGFALVSTEEVGGRNVEKTLRRNAVKEEGELAVYLMKGKIEGKPFVSIRGTEYSVLSGKAEGALRLVLAKGMLIVPKEVAGVPLAATDMRPAAVFLDTCYLLSLCRSEFGITESIKRLREEYPENSEIIITSQVLEELGRQAGNSARRTEEGNLLITNAQFGEIRQLTYDGAVSELPVEITEIERVEAANALRENTGAKKNARVGEGELSILGGIKYLSSMYERFVVRSVDSDVPALMGKLATVLP